MDRLYQALPILFTWEVVFLPLAVVALNHRCKVAEREYLAAEEQRRQLISRAEKGKVDEITEGADGTEDGASPVDKKVQSFEASGQKDVYAPAIAPPV